MEKFRKKETDVIFFRNIFRRRGILVRESYRRFVNGYDWNGNRVLRSEMVKRGLELKALRKYWLRLNGVLGSVYSLEL